MKIPEVPTDNLYKFIAITGLILFITGVLFLFYNRTTTIQQLIDIQAQKYRLISDNTVISKELSLLHKNEMNSKEYKIYLQKLNESGTINVEIMRVDALSNLLEHRLKFYEYPLLGLLFISVFIIEYGFRMWKNKLQIYQDEIIKNEAERSKINKDE